MTNANILTPPQSVVIAKAQIALFRDEIDARLAEAQAELNGLADVATTPEGAARLREKAKGVAFVAGGHVEQAKLFHYPTEVRLHAAQLAERIHTAGWGQGFTQGVDVALGYIRGYFN